MAKRLTTEQFIEKAVIVHGDKFNYSLVNYVNTYTKVTIICAKHGKFLQRPNDHLFKKGCAKCSGNIKTTKEEFIYKANRKHNNLYTYNLDNYIHGKSKIDIFCIKHGVFKQSVENHLSGQGCPSCRESKGEKQVKIFLEKNIISFFTQYRFKNCRAKNPLPFDFYVPELNLCIEYNGTQHYKSFKHFGGEEKLKTTQRNDKIKEEFCIASNINLVVIKYNENVKEKLTEFMRCKK